MFPAFLNLVSRPVVVVGGGPVAASKLEALLAAGADVTVVAPDVVPEIERAGVKVVRRGFDPSDLDGAWWVVAAAPSEVNGRVRAAADARRIFVNAVDDPRHATAYLGGVVKRGDVTLAVSTDGRAPALAGLLREALDEWLPRELNEWVTVAERERRTWKEQGVPMHERRALLLDTLNELYRRRGPESLPLLPVRESRPPLPGCVSLVGAGPGDAGLWTIRGARRLAEADLVLYDALVDAEALRAATNAQCFCVGKRARRDSVPQDTIHRLMIRAARQGKRVVRLKGGDPFVFGRGGEEVLALARAGIPVEVVPGVTSATAAPELAGIPVTHRGVASAFLVLAGHTAASVDDTLASIRPNSLSIVILMGIGVRQTLASQLMNHGWMPATPSAVVCNAGMPNQWTWTGRLDAVGRSQPPDGAAGVLVVGEVVRVRDELLRISNDATGDAADAGDEVRYGRS